MLQSAFSLVRLLCSNGVATAALPELQQLSASACRHLSQLAAQSSSNSSSWNHSSHQLPPLVQPALDIPRHQIEDGLPEVTAWLRQDSGTNFCNKLRKGGHTPCVLFSLPGNQAISLTLHSKDAARLVRQYGRNGLQAQVLRLNIQQAPPCSSASSGGSSDDDSQQQQQQQQQPLASVRVLPKEVHMNSVSLAVENFRFLFCPPDRLVTVQTPVKIWNADIAPGVKAGGWLHVVNRTMPLLCEGWAVQPHIELDVRHMRVKDVVRFGDVALPEGCRLKAKDPLQPVVRLAARVGGD